MTLRKKKYNIKLPTINFKKLWIIIAILFCGYFFIYDAIIKYFILKHHYSKLKKKLAELKKENQQLKYEVYLLHNDTDTIVYHIRKELGYIQQGEKLYILKPSSTNY